MMTTPSTLPKPSKPSKPSRAAKAAQAAKASRPTNPFAPPTRWGPARVLSVGGGRISILISPRMLRCTVLLTATVLVLALLATAFGTRWVPISDVVAGLTGQADRAVNLTVREFRLPRVAVAVLVGMALATSGAITQSLTRNPLGSPDVLGVVSGASAGAVAVMLAAGGSSVGAGGASAALSRVGVPVGAVGGALLSAAIVLGISARRFGASPATKTPKAATDASFPRTIAHDKGTTVIPARPQRIVALDNSLVEAVVLLKAPLVGGISSYRDLKGFPPYLGAAVKTTKEVGPMESPDLEAVAALEPDLIVSATVRHDALYDELSKIAPTVFVKTTGPQWQENITTLGKVLGSEGEASAALADYKQRAKKVGDAVNVKASNPTVSMVRFLDGPTRLMQKATFIGIILKDAGIARPKSQDVEDFALEVGEEQIRQADGDHIFVTSFSGGKEAKERFERNPLWKQLEGVRAGNVHDVADEIWMTSVSVQGAQLVLDDLAKTFGVNPARA